MLPAVRVLVVIPTYNEIDNITRVIAATRQALLDAQAAGQARRRAAKSPMLGQGCHLRSVTWRNATTAPTRCAAVSL